MSRKAGETMVTDKQYRDLLLKFEELSQKYAQMSRDIATIKMRLDIQQRPQRAQEPQYHKDVTRFSFMGKQLNKRQLVLECIKQYVADSGITDYGELREVFPDYIQGSLGVIRSAQEAERYSDPRGHYFFNDEDILSLGNEHYVVCKDWTRDNIDKFLDIMETLGYEIKPLNR